MMVIFMISNKVLHIGDVFTGENPQLAAIRNTCLPGLNIALVGRGEAVDLSTHKYAVCIYDIGALRTWLWEYSDAIEGFSVVYKLRLLDVQGDFNAMMDDLIAASRAFKSVSRWAKLKAAFTLWRLPALTLVSNVAPFHSDLPRHSLQRDKDAVAFHYDTSNEFFEIFLSKNMLYTAGDWSRVDTPADRHTPADLDKACEHKFDRAIEALGDIPKDARILDVGCGWGGSVAHLCKAGFTNVRGITISKEQVRWFNEQSEGPGVVDYLHYKELAEGETYDVIVGFQCTEHMPYDELKLFFSNMVGRLNSGGKLLLEFMTTTKVAKCHPFFDKYIFPDGAQFPLDTVVSVSETQQDIRLSSMYCLDKDYYYTIRQWVRQLESQEAECVDSLRSRHGEGADEKYRSFVLYLKWAEFLYGWGRSRCYTCLWESVKKS
jgi:cyclopropane-fatty-acyl-phospholipid synthase